MNSFNQPRTLTEYAEALEVRDSTNLPGTQSPRPVGKHREKILKLRKERKQRTTSNALKPPGTSGDPFGRGAPEAARGGRRGREADERRAHQGALGGLAGVRRQREV